MNRSWENYKKKMEKDYKINEMIKETKERIETLTSETSERDPMEKHQISFLKNQIDSL